MSGGSKVSSQTGDKGLLEGAENVAGDYDLKSIAKIRNAAADHTVQGNRAFNMARRAKAMARIREDQERVNLKIHQAPCRWKRIGSWRLLIPTRGANGHRSSPKPPGAKGPTPTRGANRHHSYSKPPGTKVKSFSSNTESSSEKSMARSKTPTLQTCCILQNAADWANSTSRRPSL